MRSRTANCPDDPVPVSPTTPKRIPARPSAALALMLEQRLSKEQILELYLNEIYLGLSNYGIAAAALFDERIEGA